VETVDELETERDEECQPEQQVGKSASPRGAALVMSCTRLTPEYPIPTTRSARNNRIVKRPGLRSSIGREEGAGATVSAAMLLIVIVLGTLRRAAVYDTNIPVL
jgi:hypothetical protein